MSLILGIRYYGGFLLAADGRSVSNNYLMEPTTKIKVKGSGTAVGYAGAQEWIAAYHNLLTDDAWALTHPKHVERLETLWGWHKRLDAAIGDIEKPSLGGIFVTEGAAVTFGEDTLPTPVENYCVLGMWPAVDGLLAVGWRSEMPLDHARELAYQTIKHVSQHASNVGEPHSWWATGFYPVQYF